jgi:hypothetical protein
MYSYDRRSAVPPAEAIAINLLVQDPDVTLPEAMAMVRGVEELYDEVSGEMVPSQDVVEALEKFLPKPLKGGDIRVYHATDRGTANILLRRGFIPETKPRRREGFDYAPGRGIDIGLYVGASPQAVTSYGPAILEITIPKRLLEVPSELRQLGETNPMKSLKSHDGAVINTRLPPDVFRLLP